MCVILTLCFFFCQMRRMTQLLKAIYGEKMYKSRNLPDWVKLAEKPSYPVVPAQGANECGIYVLRMTQLYDGQRLVEKILKSDVTPSLFSSFSCYFFYYFTFSLFVLYDNLIFNLWSTFFLIFFFSLLLKIGRRSTCSSCCSILRTCCVMKTCRLSYEI